MKRLVVGITEDTEILHPIFRRGGQGMAFDQGASRPQAQLPRKAQESYKMRGV